MTDHPATSIQDLMARQGLDRGDLVQRVGSLGGSDLGVTCVFLADVQAGREVIALDQLDTIAASLGVDPAIIDLGPWDRALRTSRGHLVLAHVRGLEWDDLHPADRPLSELPTPPWAVAYAKRVTSSAVYGYPYPGSFGLGHLFRSPGMTEQESRQRFDAIVWVIGWRHLNEEGQPFDHPEQLKAISMGMAGERDLIMETAFSSIASVIEDRVYDSLDTAI